MPHQVEHSPCCVGPWVGTLAPHRSTMDSTGESSALVSLARSQKFNNLRKRAEASHAPVGPYDTLPVTHGTGAIWSTHAVSVPCQGALSSPTVCRQQGKETLGRDQHPLRESVPHTRRQQGACIHTALQTITTWSLRSEEGERALERAGKQGVGRK